MSTIETGWNTLDIDGQVVRVYVERNESGCWRMANNAAGGYCDGGTRVHGFDPTNADSIQRAAQYVAP